MSDAKEDPVESAASDGEERNAAIDAALTEAFDKAGIPDDDAPPTSAKSQADQDEDDDAADPELDEEDGEEASGGEADEPDEDESVDGGEDGEEEDDEDDIDEDMALHRAYTTLHDQGIPARVLKRTPRHELISWAQSVEAGTSAKAASSSADGDPDSTGDVTKAASDSSPGASKSWADIRKGIADSMGLDESAVEALRPLYDENATLRAEMAEAKSRTDEALAQAREREGRATIDSQVRRLRKNYPELRDDEGVQKLVEEASTIVAGLRARGKDADAKTIFDKAALLTWGAPKRGDLAQLRRNGASPPPDAFGASRGSPLGDDEYWERAVGHAVNGRSDLIKRLKPPPPRDSSRARR